MAEQVAGLVVTFRAEDATSPVRAAVAAIQAIHSRPLPASLTRHLCREAISWELRELERLRQASR